MIDTACPQCGTVNRIAASLVPEGGIGKNCTSCASRFFIKKGAAATGTEKSPVVNREGTPVGPQQQPQVRASDPISPAAPIISSMDANTAGTAEKSVLNRFPISGGQQPIIPGSSPNLPLGVAAGCGGMFLGAVVWAFITVVVDYQIGWMAIGLGALVGVSIKFFGKGQDILFGIVSALLSVMGIICGNLLSLSYFLSKNPNFIDASIPGIFLSVIFQPSYAMSLLGSMFRPIDLIFYALAVSAGYRIAVNNPS
jgi:hypothetical protein